MSLYLYHVGNYLSCYGEFGTGGIETEKF